MNLLSIVKKAYLNMIRKSDESKLDELFNGAHDLIRDSVSRRRDYVDYVVHAQKYIKKYGEKYNPK